MTYKMLDAQIKASAKRRHNGYVAQAALKGVKLEPYKEAEPVKEEEVVNARNLVQELLKKKRNHGQ